MKEARECWTALEIELTPSELKVGDSQVMQSWESPLMETMAKAVTRKGGEILEVGFGMGISAQAIAARGCSTYTVIEAHPAIAEQARQWGERQNFPVRVIEAFWQDVVGHLGKSYDGILFDTYPLTPDERSCNHFPFIPVAPRLLRPGGLLTYYSDETRHFRPEHLLLLLENFRDVQLLLVEGLRPFSHCRYWQHDHMVIPVASHP